MHMLELVITEDAFLFRATPYDEFLFYEDVISYEFTSQSGLVARFASHIQTQPERLSVADLVDKQRTIYVVVGSFDDKNFGHFYWEVCIYIEHLKKIKKQFSNAIFLIREPKPYIKKILKHHQLEFENEIKTSHNYVGFFPVFITSLVNNSHGILYEDLLNRFYYESHRLNKSVTSKDLLVLYLPRAISGNYPYENQRTIEDQSIRNLVNNVPGGRGLVLEAEHNDDWAYEISAIKRAQFVIVPDGSAYAVAGFNAYGSTIIVLGSDLVLTGTKKFDKTKLINQLIMKKNSVFFIKPNRNGTVESYNLAHIIPILQENILSFRFL